MTCQSCSEVYPVEDGIPDFSEGVYYDEFAGPEALSAANRAGLEHEVAGAVSRIEDFYAPLIAQHGRLIGRQLRVLDSGCGNGISIDILNERGVEAWGNDISRLRRWQWNERRHPKRLVLADTRTIPFPNGFFDCVISSGVLEHIGVTESGSPRYTVTPLPSRDAARISFLRELLRVTADDGVLFLDFPNGLFPIDFWHGDSPGGARFHALSEGFLPTFRDTRRYVASLGEYRVTPISPHRRLRMNQVGMHWFGKAFKVPMALLLRLMNLPPLQPLSGTFINPYLVLAVNRQGPVADS